MMTGVGVFCFEEGKSDLSLIPFGSLIFVVQLDLIKQK